MFAAALFLLLEGHLDDIATVIIDVEYEGYVGKKSQAHKMALVTFRKAREPGKRITAGELLNLC